MNGNSDMRIQVNIAQNQMDKLKYLFKRQILQKSQFFLVPIYICLFDLRNTPISNNLPSPSQLMFGRIMRINIPVYGKVFKPNIQNYKGATL